jgi:hypothetical protein
VVLADTHLRTGVAGLPVEVRAALGRADVILHAGDVVDAQLLDDLARVAPTHAVLGNNDHGLRGRLPERLEVDLGGVAVAMVHDSGPTAGRAGRLRRGSPMRPFLPGTATPPLDERRSDGQRLFSPGSPLRGASPVPPSACFRVHERAGSARDRPAGAGRPQLASQARVPGPPRVARLASFRLGGCSRSRPPCTA